MTGRSLVVEKASCHTERDRSRRGHRKGGLAANHVVASKLKTEIKTEDRKGQKLWLEGNSKAGGASSSTARYGNWNAFKYVSLRVSTGPLHGTSKDKIQP